MDPLLRKILPAPPSIAFPVFTSKFPLCVNAFPVRIDTPLEVKEDAVAMLTSPPAPISLAPEINETDPPVATDECPALAMILPPRLLSESPALNLISPALVGDAPLVIEIAPEEVVFALPDWIKIP